MDLGLCNPYLMITIVPSNRLNESLTYPYNPYPITFNKNSMMNTAVNIKLNISNVSVNSFG